MAGTNVLTVRPHTHTHTDRQRDRQTHSDTGRTHLQPLRFTQLYINAPKDNSYSTDTRLNSRQAVAVVVVVVVRSTGTKFAVDKRRVHNRVQYTGLLILYTVCLDVLVSAFGRTWVAPNAPNSPMKDYHSYTTGYSANVTTSISVTQILLMSIKDVK